MLGVDPGATQAEIKAAHRALVRRHHPDVAAPQDRAEATRRVQEINVAYGLVRDAQRRAEYDRLVASGERGMDRLVTAAGVWAGRWWRRNRVPLQRGAAAAQAGLQATGRAARVAAAETLGRFLWLLLCAAGLVVGWLAAWASQRVVGVVGFVTPLAGTLGGLALGNQRGWRTRMRLAGIRLPPDAARLALAGWILAMAVALALDARFSGAGP